MGNRYVNVQDLLPGDKILSLGIPRIVVSITIGQVSVMVKTTSADKSYILPQNPYTEYPIGKEIFVFGEEEDQAQEQE